MEEVSWHHPHLPVHKECKQKCLELHSIELLIRVFRMNYIAKGCSDQIRVDLVH